MEETAWDRWSVSTVEDAAAAQGAGAGRLRRRLTGPRKLGLPSIEALEEAKS